MVGIQILTQGAAARRELAGRSMTLYGANNAARSFVYSQQGGAGTITVVLPAQSQSADQIAALTASAIGQHSDFVASANGNVVTVESTAKASFSDASAGDTGFALQILQEGVPPTNRAYLLADPQQIASDAGWRLQGMSPRGFLGYREGILEMAAPTNGGNSTGFAEQWDSDSAFDPSTGKFTVPVTGKWLVGMSYEQLGNAGGTDPRIQIRCGINGVSGNLCGSDWNVRNYYSGVGLPGSTIAILNAGAQIWAWLAMHYGPAGNDLYVTKSRFWAFYLGE